ncbi:MAG: ribosome maturation factor RimM [Chloroflexota bacterium]
MSDTVINQPAPEPEHLIVGQVVGTFGVKGEMKVNIMTEFPDRFSKLEAVILAPYSFMAAADVPTGSLDPGTVRTASIREGQTFRPPKQPTPYQIESTQIHKGQLLLKVEGVNDPESAQALRGYWVLVPREQARKLPRGAYYIYQIIGLDVYTTAGDLVGKIEDVLTTSANDVYVVRGPGVKDSTGELLVPAIKQFVKKLDVEGGRVVIVPPSEWA